MKLSVVCPIYNEEKYIEQVIAFFQQALPLEKELFLIDGGSTDSTKAIIASFTDANIHLIDNPDKIVPFALNKAIPLCKGEFIVRLDAHTEYHKDYFTEILATFEKTDASIVGGPMIAAGETPTQRAVAYCTSTSFGVGNSKFHDSAYEGYVDSVYLGAWRREIFDELGLFDTRLKRNQDDEFHYRAKSKGHKIYLNPSIKSKYYPRDTFAKLFKQYHQYGLYKPMVLRKIKSEIKLRHLIPSCFCLYFILLPILSVVSTVFAIPAYMYLLLDVYFSFSNKMDFKEKIQSLFIYPTLHIAYGSGFVLGLFKK